MTNQSLIEQLQDINREIEITARLLARKMTTYYKTLATQKYYKQLAERQFDHIVTTEIKNWLENDLHTLANWVDEALQYNFLEDHYVGEVMKANQEKATRH